MTRRLRGPVVPSMVPPTLAQLKALVPGLIACWPMSESSGGVLHETIGLRHATTAGGAALGGDPLGLGVASAGFDGSDGTAATTAFASLGPATYSWGVLFRPTDEPGTARTVFSCRYTAADGIYANGYHAGIRRRTNGALEAMVTRADATNESPNASTVIAPDEICCAVLTNDGTDVNLYVNGMLDGSATLSGGFAGAGTPVVRFSGTNATPQTPWQGDISQAWLTSEVLDADQVKAISDYMLGPGPVLYSDSFNRPDGGLDGTTADAALGGATFSWGTVASGVIISSGKVGRSSGSADRVARADVGSAQMRVSVTLAAARNGVVGAAAAGSDTGNCVTLVVEAGTTRLALIDRASSTDTTVATSADGVFKAGDRVTLVVNSAGDQAYGMVNNTIVIPPTSLPNTHTGTYAGLYVASGAASSVIDDFVVHAR